MQLASNLARKALVLCRGCKGRGFASSVARYFAHVMLFKPTGLQATIRGFCVCLHNSMHAQKINFPQKSRQDRHIHIAKAKVLFFLGGVIIKRTLATVLAFKLQFQIEKGQPVNIQMIVLAIRDCTCEFVTICVLSSQLISLQLLNGLICPNCVGI